jgi:galactose-1-phosphate uridylyltransferase
MTELTRKVLEAHLVNSNLEQVSYQEVIQFFHQDEELKKHAPDRYAEMDPRTGVYILYSKARRHRPHDYPVLQEKSTPTQTVCPICAGKLTSVWDIAELSEGYTFINENLFPGIFPFTTEGWPLISSAAPECCRQRMPALGTHFLQWHSTLHDKDINNMQVSDIFINLERLAVLEKFLLTQASPMPVSHTCDGIEYHGYVGVVKNYGREVGGSLRHGHMQILHVNIQPKRLQQDMALLTCCGKGFSAILQERNTPELTIRAYGHGTMLFLTPFCMKRPLEGIICCQDTAKNYLHQLTSGELKLLAQALHDATRGIITMQAQQGREVAYNLVFHVGPIGGLYIEVLPYNQEVGGYESLGIYFSHLTPDESTLSYRGVMENG